MKQASYWDRYRSDFVKLLIGVFSFVLAHAVTLYSAYIAHGMGTDATRLVYVWIRELIPWGVIVLALAAALLAGLTAFLPIDRKRVPYLWIWLGLVVVGAVLSLVHFAIGQRM